MKGREVNVGNGSSRRGRVKGHGEQGGTVEFLERRWEEEGKKGRGKKGAEG